jgi:hypothetical protein
MKKLYFSLLCLTTIVLCISCTKDDPNVISGDQSPMGQVGVVVESSSVEMAGVSNFSATIIALKGGVSSYNGSATVKNEILRNLVANIPGFTIDGDKVTALNIESKQTKEGFDLKTGPGAGVLVKYSSSVGDTYKIGTTGEVRTVVAKTGVDDYPYGFYLIKVIRVEENPKYLKSFGVTKITYIANHKYGLVGVMFNFDDGTSVEFPIYTTGEN